MAIDPLADDLISLTQASRQMRRLNAPAPHVATLHRWVKRGLNGIRLDAKRVGRRWYTTADALRSFIDQCSEADRIDDRSLPRTAISETRNADDGRHAETEMELKRRFRV